MFGGKTFKSAKKSSAKAQKVVAEQEEVAEVVTPEVEVNDPFIAELIKAGNVRLAIYTGQFTRDETSGVDIVVVGDVNQTAVEHLISELEKTEKKELRYSVFSDDEFVYRRQVNDRFVSNLLAAKKIVLVDKDKLLQ
jgi:ABC-type methionine transport system ATPase subunit